MLDRMSVIFEGILGYAEIYPRQLLFKTCFLIVHGIAIIHRFHLSEHTPQHKNYEKELYKL